MKTFGDRASLLAFTNMSMFLKHDKGVDHCSKNDLFSSVLYPQTNTTIEKISKNLAKNRIDQSLMLSQHSNKATGV